MPILSFPDNLNQYPFSSPSIKLSIENLFPRSKIKFPVCDGDNNFPSHDLPFQVRIAIIFTRPIVQVL